MRQFKEEQRFTQLWLLVLLGISGAVPILIILKEYLKENSTITTNECILSLLGIILSLGGLFIFKLTTRIDHEGIHYQFFPIHLSMKTINWDELQSVKVITYDPIGEYGGWGIRGSNFWNKEKGKAFTISGDIGIQLELKKGKKLLIGTKKKAEAIEVLENYQAKIIQ